MAGIVDQVGVTPTTFANALKVQLMDGAEAFFHSRATLLGRFEKNSEGMVGTYIKGAKESKRVEGFGGSHTSRLADTDENGFVNPEGEAARFSARGKIDHKLMQQARNNVGAFAESLKSYMSSLLRDQRFDLSASLYGDGSGRIATLTGVGSLSAGQLTVRHPFDTAAQGDDITQNRVRPGMYVGILDSSACTTGNGNQVFHTTATGGPESITSTTIKHFYVSAVSGNVVTLMMPDRVTPIDLRADTTGNLDNAPVAGANPDYLVRTIIREKTSKTGTPSDYSSNATFRDLTGYRQKGSVDSGGTYGTTNIHFGAAELIGLSAYSSSGGVYMDMGGSSTATSGNVCGISTTDNPEWAGLVIQGASPGTAEAITREKVMRCLDYIELRGESKSNIVMVCHPRVHLRMAEIFVHSDLQYQDTPRSKDVITRDIMFQGVSVIRDLACPGSVVYVFDESELKIKWLQSMSWIDDDGAILSRMPDHSAYQFAMTFFAQTWINRRNRFARIEDVKWAA